MKKLPIGIQSFSNLLNEDYIYVDKTDLAFKLISSGQHFFMSRPRRFGKSLFVSTLKHILQGDKKLFENCGIYKTDYDWKPHPVIHLDFAQIPNDSAKDLKGGVIEILEDIAKKYDISVSGASFQTQLKRLINELSNKMGRVCILIDEYDKPIVDHLCHPAIAIENQKVLKDLYSTLKGLDSDIRFTFVTGISKFAQVSLFSGPNYLRDITMDEDYAGLMGYTQEDVEYHFKPYISQIAKKKHKTPEAITSEVKLWYNGYRFTKKELSVYNPFSTLTYMSTGETEGHWYRTGTPSFLIEQVKKHPKSLAPLSGATSLKSALMDISSLEQIDLTALMFQTGYFTIKKCTESGIYHLDFPNEEVKQAFLGSLVTCFAPIDNASSTLCQEHLENDQLEPFFNHLKAIFASFPYHLFSKAAESTYHGMLLAILKGMGFDAMAEQPTNLGQIDVVIDTPKTTFVVECKLNASADTALEQINDKKYYEKYLQSSKDVVLVGINFSSTERNISEWKEIKI